MTRRGPLPIDLDEWLKIRDLYLAGKKANEIAWEVGRTDACVISRLKWFGIWKPAKLQTPWQETTAAQLAHLHHTEAKSFEEIGRLFGVGKSTVRDRFRVLGVAGRKRVRPRRAAA